MTSTEDEASPEDEAAAEDRELLRAHVAGDPDAFGTLFARHRDRLWAVALRTTGDPEDAADALQDALVSAFRRADSYRGDAAVTTWLHRVVVNACLDRLRRRAVRRAEPLPDDLDRRPARSSSRPRSPAPVPEVDASATVVDPADVAVDDERRAAVLDALATLPADQRAALVLVDMEGYSVAETAAILDCAPGTVKSRCARGRARLLPLLVEHRPSRAGGVPGRNPRDARRVPPVGDRAGPGPARHDQQAPPSGGPTIPEQEVSSGDA